MNVHQVRAMSRRPIVAIAIVLLVIVCVMIFFRSDDEILPVVSLTKVVRSRTSCSEATATCSPCPTMTCPKQTAAAALDDAETFATRMLAGRSKPVVLSGSCGAQAMESIAPGSYVLCTNFQKEHIEWDRAIEGNWIEELVRHVLKEGPSWAMAKRLPNPSNPALDVLLKDRMSEEYKYQRKSTECYALLIQPPMDQYMYDNAFNVVFSLRKFDAAREVIVFLVIAAEDQRPTVDNLASKFRALGARVFIRNGLPLRDVDYKMYYRFDYNKLFVWNLPYERVMFLDADMVVRSSPALAFAICRSRYHVCAVQEIRNYGGYFNNGMFILAYPQREELLRHIVQVWWKPNPPWRQICLQDVMNEAYRNQWQPLPEAFNVQGFKHGIWSDTSYAVFLHFRDCHKLDPSVSHCKIWHEMQALRLNLTKTQ